MSNITCQNSIATTRQEAFFEAKSTVAVSPCRRVTVASKHSFSSDWTWLGAVSTPSVYWSIVRWAQNEKNGRW